MTAPSYRKRLMLLEEVLTEGEKLFRMLLQSEEQLRELLIRGDYKAVLDAEEKRSIIRKNIEQMEEKRKMIISEGESLRSYIKAKIGKSRQDQMIAVLDNIREVLLQIKAFNEVNRVLLEERLRFSKELQACLTANRLTYNEKGKLRKGNQGPLQSLDRNC